VVSASADEGEAAGAPEGVVDDAEEGVGAAVVERRTGAIQVAAAGTEPFAAGAALAAGDPVEDGDPVADGAVEEPASCCPETVERRSGAVVGPGTAVRDTVVAARIGACGLSAAAAPPPRGDINIGGLLARGEVETRIPAAGCNAEATGSGPGSAFRPIGRPPANRRRTTVDG